jgi:sulfur-oxidizing protein SoxY
MSSGRRRFLRTGTVLVAALGAHRLRAAGSAERNQAAFQAKSAAEALKSIGAASAVPSKEIVLKLPDVAENGGQVPIEITSRVAHTEAIHIVADKNPFPLVASFDLPSGVEPYVVTRIKLADTSPVRVLVKADGKFYSASREVRVTVGGCGV